MYLASTSQHRLPAVYRRLFAAGLVSLALLSGEAMAQHMRKPIFISPEQLDVASILPNPPLDNSSAEKAELSELHHLQDTRQPEQIAHVKADDIEEDIFVFKDVLGEKFSATLLPQTAILSAHVHSDEGVIVSPAKNQFHRLRPFNFDSTIKPVCKVNADIHDYGYPSGHSTTGYLEALVLVMIVPEKRDAIMARADDAQSRVVCGIHYPTDVVASKYVAYAMMGIMMNNPQFRKELGAARAETRQALGL